MKNLELAIKDYKEMLKNKNLTNYEKEIIKERIETLQIEWLKEMQK